MFIKLNSLQDYKEMACLILRFGPDTYQFGSGYKGQSGQTLIKRRSKFQWCLLCFGFEQFAE